MVRAASNRELLDRGHSEAIEDRAGARTMKRSITAVSAAPRERHALAEHGELTLALQVQRCRERAALADVLYVHGATFGADLSLYFAFDGRSWADALCEAGFDAWGFDFA